MRPTLPGRRAVTALVTGVLASLVGLGPVAASTPDGTIGPAASRESQTTISLVVEGCEGCTIQSVQSRRGVLSYLGPLTTVVDGRAAWTVPTSRTRRMSMLFNAPFDELARGGLPAVAVTGFRAKRPGSTIHDDYVRGRRSVSGCWAGTSRSAVSGTLVVHRRTSHGQTVAVGWLRHTWRSRDYWWTLPGADYHVRDPVICR